ncbi:hypothetical protein JYU34_016980 [Plutella xylostella]|uniref:FP protein C-terminal domain-containing protein n=1 Tax=Plutella xylostella TaxID=51655 RepID=A0ABQ7Q408_PLUXY|nr:hypothetical protein JYU34_016980 [Plutella xylostella]
MPVCSGCTVELGEKKLFCKQCKGFYDLSCANVLEKDYNKFTLDEKTCWICAFCKSKNRKGGDNSNTPVRSSSALKPTEEDRAAHVTLRSRDRQRGLSGPPPPADHDVGHTGCVRIEELKDLIAKEIKENLNSSMIGIISTKLEPQLKNIREELADYSQAMKFFNEKFEEMVIRQGEYIDKVKTLEKDNQFLRDHVEKLNQRLKQIEDNARSANVEIQCLPENRSENLVSTVQQLGNVVKCPLNSSDILYCSRVAKMNTDSNRPRNVIVKLSSPMQRDTLLAACIKFNKSNQNDKLNTSHLGIAVDKKAPVYICEHLSPETKSLHAAARLKARELNYKFVWVRKNRVFMRKTEASDYVLIRNIEFLSKLT